MQARVERGVGAAQRLGRERGGEVRDPHEATRIEARKRKQRGHRLGAVDEREPFLGAELQRGEPGSAQTFGGGRDPTVDPNPPAPDQR